MVTEKQSTQVVDPETGEITTLQESVFPIWLIDAYDETMRKRFISGTNHEYRIKNSLELGGNSRLYAESTLLLENQQKSASAANALFQKKLINALRSEKAISSKFRKIKTEKYNHYPTDDHSVAEKKIRLLTIIHSVSALNVNAAIIDVRELINDFNKCAKKAAGISCYAVIEVEVISYRMMKASNEYEKKLKESTKAEPTFDQQKENQHIKFHNYGVLGEHLGDEVLNGEQGQLCIHLHGLVVGKNETALDNFLRILESHNAWKEGIKRIQMKKLSKQFFSENKPVSLSLHDISRYMFKGGCILNQGKPYLHYKIDHRNDKLTTYEEYLMSESLYDECDDSSDFVYPKKKYTTDFLSLSHLEINVLVEVNDAMMNLNKNKTGHIIKNGHW